MKIKPETDDIKEIVDVESERIDDYRILKRDVDEAELQNMTGTALIVPDDVKQVPTLDQADAIGSQIAAGDQLAQKELYSAIKVSNDALNNALEQYKIVGVAEQKSLLKCNTPEQKRYAWLVQQMAKNEEKRQAMQMVMRTLRQLQHLRVGIGNRLFAWGRINILGLRPSQGNDELNNKQASRIMKEIKEDYNKITKGMVSRIIMHGNLPEDSRLDKHILTLVDTYVFLELEEEKIIRRIAALCEDFEIYNRFFKLVPGVGPISAGGLIALLDISKARYASSFVKYAGYDVVKRWDDEKGDWIFEGRSKRKEHLEEKTYIDRDGVQRTKLSITFNPEVKCLMYNLATSFMKIRNRVKDDFLEGWPGYKIPNYGMIYENYKHRKMVDNELNEAKKTLSHIDLMAKRLTSKIFLQELHPVWCYLLGAYEKIRLPWHVVYTENQEYHPTFSPLRQIVEHSVRDKAKVRELKQREEELRRAGFARPF